MSAEIFDRRARRRHAVRAAATRGAHDFLVQALADGIAERLTGVTRQFERILDIGGAMGARLPGALSCGLGGDVAVIAEEDRLPFADASFDLVVSAGVLQGVGDLPGALVLARRCLVPDGLFMASFFGGATLGELRADLLAAESELTGRVAARVHPMVDPREGGALLQRAGFALPVADVDTLTVRYDHLFALLADVRGTGDANALTGRVPLRRDVLADAARRFAGRGGGGRIAVRVDVVTLTGWAPAASQPQPLKPGSATVSLADALRANR